MTKMETVQRLTKSRVDSKKTTICSVAESQMAVMQHAAEIILEFDQLSRRNLETSAQTEEALRQLLRASKEAVAALRKIQSMGEALQRKSTVMAITLGWLLGALTLMSLLLLSPKVLRTLWALAVAMSR